MKLNEINEKFKIMQDLYGDSSLDAVFGNGKLNPKLCLVFMNPTAKNIATEKSWKGIKSQWLGTKQIWNFLTDCDLFSKELNNEIQTKKRNDWDYDFSKKVYDEVIKNNLYITNLAKCTQLDARIIPNKVYEEYRDLLFEELYEVNPEKIILFGSTVAKNILGVNEKLSEIRKKEFSLKIKDKVFSCYVLYYPVGNGFMNKDKAIYDLKIVKGD